MTLTTTFALAALAVGAVACSDELVGQRCRIGADAGDPEQVIIASPSLDCPSRACLHTPEGGEDVCTADCTSDDDCAAAEGSPCAGGFTCGTPVVVGPFACRRMCMCRDGLVIPEGGLPTPEACR